MSFENEYNSDAMVMGNDVTGITLKSASTWVTEDESIPDPKVDVLGQFVAIRPLSVQKKTKSGLILPDIAAERAERQLSVGKVIGVGEKACQRDGVSLVKVGDTVLFPKYGNAEVTVSGVRIVLCYDDLLLCRVDPEDVTHGLTVK